jgi:hypothetical protein
VGSDGCSGTAHIGFASKVGIHNKFTIFDNMDVFMQKGMINHELWFNQVIILLCFAKTICH